MSQENGLLRMKERTRQFHKERRIKIDINKTEYPILRNIMVNDLGWTIWGRKEQKANANLFWSDTYIADDFVKKLRPYQRINHFPNSQQLGKKNLLSNNIKRMKMLFPTQYNFYPETWSLPEDSAQFEVYQADKGDKEQTKPWLIVKPVAMSQGKGIYLTKEVTVDSKDPMVVQEYIGNPLLIDGCKFDLRIYVFVKSLIPLKIFRFEQGLARLSTATYEDPSKSNKANLNMHLTNYAINKLSPNFIPNRRIEDNFTGHKRSLTAVFHHLESLGCNQSELQAQIDDIIIKTILSAYPKLLQSYKECRNVMNEIESTCFEILGFDVLIDRDFKPWLLEVNHSPSFTTDSPLDFVIKKYLLLDTLVLLNLDPEDKEHFLKFQANEKDTHLNNRDLVKARRKADAQFEETHLGGFHKIYPNNNKIYEVLFNRLANSNRRASRPRKKQYKSQNAIRRQSSTILNQLNSSLTGPKVPTSSTNSQLLFSIKNSRIPRNAQSFYGSIQHLISHSHSQNNHHNYNYNYNYNSNQQQPTQFDQDFLNFNVNFNFNGNANANANNSNGNMSKSMNGNINSNMKKQAVQDKRKIIEQVKVNNVYIKFFQEARNYYNYSCFGKRSLLSSRNQRHHGNMKQPSQSMAFDSKTAEGDHIDFRKLDYDIRIRIEKNKLARLKINKMNSRDRKSESQPRRVIADPLRFQLNELRAYNKYI